MNERDNIRGRADLARALKRGLRDAYDNLGYVVFASLASSVAASALLTVGLLVVRALRPGMFVGSALLLPAALVAWLCATGVFYYVNKVVFHEYPVPAETLAGIRRLLRPALGLFVVNLMVHAVLVGDTMLLLHLSTVGHSIGFAMLAIFCGYLWLAWSMMSLYQLPLLAAQLKMESGPRVAVVLRKCFLLAIDNPGFTVGLFLAIIAFAVLCAIPAMVGMALVFLGAAAFVLTHALRELFVKYGVVEEEPEVVEDRPWRMPDS